MPDYEDVDDTDITEDEFDQVFAASEPVVVHASRAEYLLAEQYGAAVVGLSQNYIGVTHALAEPSYIPNPLADGVYATWMPQPGQLAVPSYLDASSSR